MHRSISCRGPFDIQPDWTVIRGNARHCAMCDPSIKKPQITAQRRAVKRTNRAARRECPPGRYDTEASMERAEPLRHRPFVKVPRDHRCRAIAICGMVAQRTRLAPTPSPQQAEMRADYGDTLVVGPLANLVPRNSHQHRAAGFQPRHWQTGGLQNTPSPTNQDGISMPAKACIRFRDMRRIVVRLLINEEPRQGGGTCPKPLVGLLKYDDIGIDL